MSKSFTFQVEEPEKHTEGFISYLVVGNTNREDFNEKQFSVRRRYQDFLWLHDSLFESFPFIIIPPLPKKGYKLDNFNANFIDQRKKALKIFLERIGSHVVLSNSDHFKSFLTATNWELLTMKKEFEKPLINKFGDSFKHLYKNISTTHKSEFASTITHLNELATNISSTVDNFEYLTVISSDLGTTHNELKTNYGLWLHSEPALSSRLTCMRNCNEVASNAYNKLKDDLTNESLLLFKEYLNYTDSVKETIKNFDSVSSSLKDVENDISKKEVEKSKIRAGEKSITNFFQSSNDTLFKLEESIRELNIEKNSLHDKYSKSKEDVLSGLDVWNQQKTADFKQVIMTTSSLHIDMLSNMIDQFEKYQLENSI